VTCMRSMFEQAHAFNGDVKSWCVGNVTHAGFMFHGALAFNGDLRSWIVLGIENCTHMFYGARSFNGDLSRWCLMHVTHMSCWLDETPAFDGRLNPSIVNRMHSLYCRRQPKLLWRIARRLLCPVAKARCIVWFWMELAARPDRNGRPPPAYFDAFALDFQDEAAHPALVRCARAHFVSRQNSTRAPQG